MWIGRQKGLRSRVEIREVASTTARDGDLFSDASRVLDNEDFTSSFSSFYRTKKSRGSTTDHDHIPMASGTHGR